MQHLNLCSQSTTTPIILLILIVQLITHVATSSTPSSSYTSITHLDKYGSSTQIKNARLASQLYGSTTIAAIATSSSTNNSNNNEFIVVVSREAQTPGVIQPLQNHKLQILATNPSTTTSITAVIGSGLKSDITFLTNLLRRHASLHWERYDSIPDSHRMAQSTGLILQAFQGYERGDEVGDGIPDVLLDESGKRMSLGRPLAASLLLVDVLGSNMKDDDDGSSRATMVAVDPSGIVSEPLVAFGLGRGGEKANEMLRERWRPNLSVDEVEDLCVGMLRDIVALEEEGKGDTSDAVHEDAAARVRVNDDDNDDGGDIDYIVCEILSKDGLRAKKVRLTKEKVS